VVNRSAFTLIELVFAIVIIAISVVSLPTMNQAIAKGTDANLVQEAIFAASAKLNDTLSAHWDENSIDHNETNTLAGVIDDGSCENNLSLPTAREKPGHINQPLHRRCLNDSSITPDDSNNTTNLIDDINDLVVTDVNLTTTGIVDATGYKKLYTITISVSRPASFGETANNPNIKQVKADIKDSSGNLVTSLKAYSANIGEIDYYRRSF